MGQALTHCLYLRGVIIAAEDLCEELDGVIQLIYGLSTVNGDRAEKNALILICGMLDDIKERIATEHGKNME